MKRKTKSKSVVEELAKKKDSCSKRKGKVVKIKKPPKNTNKLSKNTEKIPEKSEKNKEKDKKPTTKQQLFCHEYIKDGDAKAAAIRAGYSEKTAKEQGSRLLTKVHVRAYVDELMKKSEEEAIVERTDILRTLKEQAFAKIPDYMNEAGDIELDKVKKAGTDVVEYSEYTGKYGTSRRIRLRDSQGACDKICKMEGWYAPVKTFVKGNLTTREEGPSEDLSQLTDEELDQLIALNEKIAVRNEEKTGEKRGSKG